MATWQAISKRNLRTAKEVAPHDPRSSLSRSYYAAFSALSAVLGSVDGAFPRGWETPRHAHLPRLVLTHGDPQWRDSVERNIRILYRLRLDADDRSTVELGTSEAEKAAKVAQQIRSARMNKQEVEGLVKDQLQAHGLLTVAILAGGIQPDEDWWYVPVIANPPPKDRMDYYLELADIEDELRKSRGVKVLLIPAEN